MRANPFIVRTMIEHGRPNPFATDLQGQNALHVATLKMDKEHFEALIKLGGSPMAPDGEGNTCLHLLCEGAVRDVEYDFIKELVEKYDMRLSRNHEGKTPLNVIRAYPKKPMNSRGQLNFRRKVWEYFESVLKQDQEFEDATTNEPIHLAVIDGNIGELRNLVSKNPKIRERRNMDGKTLLMLAVEHDQSEVFNWLLE